MLKYFYNNIRKVNFMLTITILTILFLLLFGFSKISRINNFNFFPSSKYINLSENINFFIPQNNESLGLSQVINDYDNAFTKNIFNSIYFPQHSGKVWLKVNLDGTQSESINVLYLDSNFIENIEFYIPTTDNKFLAARPNGYFLFPFIYLPKNTDYHKDIYISLNWTSNQFNLYTTKNSDFYIFQSFLTIFFVCNLGIVLGMIIMNIILFFTSKDSKYIYHSLFTVSLLTILYCLSGIPNLLFGYISYNDFITPGALVALTWILFIYSYLDIKESLPLINKIFKISIVILMLTLFVSNIIPNKFTYEIIYLYMLLTGLSIVISMYCYFKFKIGSIYYLTGISILFAGVILYFLAVNNKLKWNMITSTAWCPALSIETLLFTIGIIDQIKTEKERNNKLQKEVVTDKLTNLYNRRYIDEIVIKQISELDLTKDSISMMLFDIDHFKNFNDTYGHDVGDSVLAEASTLISQCLEKDDILCRWGGEEFVAILFFTNLHDSIEVAENIRITVENYKFEHIGKYWNF